MPLQADAIFRHLPPLLRKAGPETPAWPLSRMLVRTVSDLERTGKEVLRAHFLDDARDLVDLEKLGAVYRMSPWLEEDPAAYRARLKLMIGVYTKGAATAGRLLTVAAAAAGGEVTGLLYPQQHLWAGESPVKLYLTDRFTTYAFLQREADQFGAAVVDLPPVLRTLTVDAAPDGTLEWQVENDLFGSVGGWTPDGWVDDTWPDPVIEIEAGAVPVPFPILVQRNLRRLVLVNRFLPPGCRVRVDLVNHVLTDVSGPASLMTGLIVPPAEAGGPDLIYGTGALLGESAVSGHPAVPPAHVLRWYLPGKVLFGTDQPLVPGPLGAVVPAPGELSWPSLLGDGTSHWRLLVGAVLDGGPVAPNQLLPLAKLRAVLPTAATGPAKVIFTWEGRQLGTFTMLIDPARLPGARRPWLEEQIRRLKLAGILYLPWEETTLTLDMLDGQLV
ncbi:MAG: hypothetical protein K0R39_3397 [Symbiobacteriaceae bacterium]|jgi:hypothetical protein|nr:hypothetical protein [Symbiobacteriaceae bacterium]